jgi:hypothetical protein
MKDKKKSIYKVGFKLVSVISGERLSYNCNVCGDNKEGKETGEVLVYKPGVWTRPKKGNGPLALFTSKEEAVTYARDWWCETEVFPCVYVPHTGPHKRCFITIREYMQECFREAPKGQVLADRLVIMDAPVWRSAD